MDKMRSAPEPAPQSFSLVLIDGGKQTMIAARAPFRIGRSPEMDLVLPHPFISRRQAEILFNSASQDLDLVCGGAPCFINGELVNRHALVSGDEIRLGSLDGPLLRFSSGVCSTRSLRDTLNQLKQPANANADLARLTWFVEAAKRVNGVGALEEILAALIDTTLELTAVERGYVFLKNSAGELRLAAGRGSSGRTLEDDSTVSYSAIYQALRSGCEFIVTDTLSAESGAPSESIIVQSIRAVICIPLRKHSSAEGLAEEQVFGALYLDSRQERANLTRLDSELLSRIAAEAALLVENAFLIQEEMSARRYREELLLACQIQQSLMSVRIPQLLFAEVEATSIPCKGIGGDVYDVLCHDHALYIVLADISGKGVSAAVLGSTLQGLIHGQILSNLSLPEIALFANRYICQRDVRKYATMILFRLTSDGVAEYINCGHVRPIVHTSGDTSPDSIVRLTNCNLPVGLMPDATYESETLQLLSGQRVLFLTDGATEVEGPSSNEFGDGPLQSLIAATATLSQIFVEIAAFTAGAPLQDDCTVVDLRYRSPRTQ